METEKDGGKRKTMKMRGKTQIEKEKGTRDERESNRDHRHKDIRRQRDGETEERKKVVEN